jgi:hypothetical protein
MAADHSSLSTPFVPPRKATVSGRSVRAMMGRNRL